VVIRDHRRREQRREGERGVRGMKDGGVRKEMEEKGEKAKIRGQNRWQYEGHRETYSPFTNSRSTSSLNVPDPPVPLRPSACILPTSAELRVLRKVGKKTAHTFFLSNPTTLSVNTAIARLNLRSCSWSRAYLFCSIRCHRTRRSALVFLIFGDGVCGFCVSGRFG